MIVINASYDAYTKWYKYSEKTVSMSVKGKLQLSQQCLNFNIKKRSEHENRHIDSSPCHCFCWINRNSWGKKNSREYLLPFVRFSQAVALYYKNVELTERNQFLNSRKSKYFFILFLQVDGRPKYEDEGSLIGSNLITEALKNGAEFSKTCLKRLAEDIFGSGRASRSTDVVIFNKSGLKFKCTSSECGSGSYTSSLLPEHEILPKRSSVFGMESVSFLRGLDCTTKYESEDGSFFEIEACNPFYGRNSLNESWSPNLLLKHTLGSGNNNQIRWIVESVNNIDASSESSSQTSIPNSARSPIPVQISTQVHTSTSVQASTQVQTSTSVQASTPVQASNTVQASTPVETSFNTVFPSESATPVQASFPTQEPVQTSESEISTTTETPICIQDIQLGLEQTTAETPNCTSDSSVGIDLRSIS